MPKIKRMPNTKHQSKNLWPYTVTRMTESHVIIPDPKAGAGSLNKEKKLPIDIVRPTINKISDMAAQRVKENQNI